MKKSFLIFTTLFLFQFCIAQDTILKSNGDKIPAKVLEVNSDEIKYKKFDFQDGPTYTDKKSDIQMIKYSNGTKEYYEKINEAPATYTPAPIVKAPQPDLKIYNYGITYKYQYSRVSLNEVNTILLNTKDPELTRMVNDAKKYKNMGLIALGAIPMGIGVIACIATAISDEDPSILTAGGIFLAVGIACPITGGALRHKYTTKTREAILMYNRSH